MFALKKKVKALKKRWFWKMSKSSVCTLLIVASLVIWHCLLWKECNFDRRYCNDHLFNSHCIHAGFHVEVFHLWEWRKHWVFFKSSPSYGRSIQVSISRNILQMESSDNSKEIFQQFAVLLFALDFLWLLRNQCIFFCRRSESCVGSICCCVGDIRLFLQWGSCSLAFLLPFSEIIAQ